MAVGIYLRLPHELGILRKYSSTNRFKSSEMKRRRECHWRNISFSSCTTRRDGWSLYVADRVCKPLLYAPFRCNLLTCQCFPSSLYGKPLLKNTTLFLERSYNVLHESPVAIQLAPAVGVIAFAIWGLGPLMRYSRNLFLHRKDNTWKKSKTHYILSSYLQPLLLWAGATLICRSLDPVVLRSEASQVVKGRLLSFVKALSSVLAIAYCLTSMLQQTQKIFMEKNSSDDTSNMGFQFAAKAVYTAVWVAAFSLFMELLGFSTQKWVTAGGLGTVLLTLVGREIFTNFLSSIMIHTTRMFVLNEWIQAKIDGCEVSGHVEHVGWWSPTVIRGEDREAVHIPNHKFTVNIVRNLSQRTHWRIKAHLAISHLDANKINIIVADMRKLLAKNPQIEHKRLHRRVFLDNIDQENQSLLIFISCFVKTSHFEEYLCVKEAILLDLLRVISHHRARLATPIRTVQKFYSNADTEDMPFSDAIFTRAGTVLNRPLLLIEPPRRINGEEKAKPKPRSTLQSNEEQATKKTAASETKPMSATDSLAPKGLDKQQHKKLNSTDSSSESSEKPPSSETASQQMESDVSRTEDEKERTASASVARPALEDNIVLGVALDGSKRTLPMEEERRGSSPAPVEAAASEVATGHSSNADKDYKQQMPAVPGAAAVDHRDQER